MSTRFVKENRALALVCYIAMLAVVLISGCGGCGPSVDSRLESSVRSIKRRLARPELSSAHPRLQKFLVQLERATPQTLSSPVMCGAKAYYRARDDKILLLVDWIEDAPSPDAVRLLWKNEPKTRDLPIDYAMKEGNLADAEVAVPFSASFFFPRDSTTARRILLGERPFAVMMRDGKPISNAVQLEESPDIQGLRHQPRGSERPAGKADIESAGINRLEVEDERALRERFSRPSRP